jgi:hypothetical protein
VTKITDPCSSLLFLTFFTIIPPLQKKVIGVQGSYDKISCSFEAFCSLYKNNFFGVSKTNLGGGRERKNFNKYDQAYFHKFIININLTKSGERKRDSRRAYSI